MNPEEVLAQAQAALQRGDYSPAEVDAIVGANTDYPNLFALRMAVESAEHFVEAEEMREIGEHPVRSALGSIAQALSFGAVDDIVAAAQAGRQMGGRMERAQEARERHAPGADIASQVAASLLPIGGLFSATTRFTPGAMRGMLRGSATGAATGALGGGTTGYFMAPQDATPEERAAAARSGAMFGAGGGAILGAPMGFIGGVYGSNVGRGVRVGEKIVNTAQRPRAHIGLHGISHEIDDLKREVQKDFYQPLQQANKVVDHPAIEAAVFDVAADPSFRTVVLPRRLRAGQTRTGGSPRGTRGTLIRRSAALPSFEDLQDIRNKLRKLTYDREGNVKDREALAKFNMFSEAMQDAFGEDLTIADAAWSRLNRQQEAVEKGWRVFNKPSDEIEMLRDELARQGEDVLNTFDDARLARIVDEFGKKERGAVGLLTEYMNAGPSMKRRVASLFPGGIEGAAFAQFEHMLKSESRNQRIADFFNSSIKSAVIGATGGAISAGLMMSRGQQNN